MPRKEQTQQELKEIVESGTHQPKKAQRGRTNIPNPDHHERVPTPTKPMIGQVERAESNRPVSAGNAHHRGDRRDMSPTYTGSENHSARGNTQRKDVSTRKR